MVCPAAPMRPAALGGGGHPGLQRSRARAAPPRLVADRRERLDRSDVSGGTDGPCTFGAHTTLPALSKQDERQLAAGQRVQRQQLGAGYGAGYAVQELAADADAVWRAVSAFERYAELIPTVKSVEVVRDADPALGGPCFRFLVSRIRLLLHVRFGVDESARRASWELERPSWVLLHLMLRCHFEWVVYQRPTSCPIHGRFSRHRRATGMLSRSSQARAAAFGLWWRWRLRRGCLAS